MKGICNDIVYTLRYIGCVVLGLVMPFCDITFLEPFRLPSRDKAE